MKKKKDISIKDQTYWEEYIKDPNDIFDKDKTTGKSKMNISDLNLIFMAIVY